MPSRNQFSDLPPGEVVQTCPLQAEKKPAHWIEVELIGEDDQPIPYEMYRMQLPDGLEVEGYLDDAGYARIEGLSAAGTCRLHFPALDKDGWQFIETLGARP